MARIGKYIGLSECAELLGAGRSTVRKWLSDAGVTAVVLGSGPGGTIRYRAADVEKYLAQAEEELDDDEEEDQDDQDSGEEDDQDEDGEEDDQDELDGEDDADEDDADEDEDEDDDDEAA